MTVLYLDLKQVVITPVSTEVNVTFLVLPIVKTTRVTYKVERVSCVNLDGLIYIVIKVRLCYCFLYDISLVDNLLLKYSMFNEGILNDFYYHS